MATWLRAIIILAGAIFAMLGFVFVEIMLIGLIGGNVDGTGLVAFGLAPFAAIAGLITGAVVSSRLTRSRRSEAGEAVADD